MGLVHTQSRKSVKSKKKLRLPNNFKIFILNKKIQNSSLIYI